MEEDWLPISIYKNIQTTHLLCKQLRVAAELRAAQNADLSIEVAFLANVSATALSEMSYKL